jgi:TatD DNase family protein
VTDSAVRWTDSHCHLPAGDEASEVVADARAAGVERMVNVGTDLEHSRQAVGAARRHEGVWATAGVHPHDARQGLDGIAELLDAPQVVAVGECGLDFHYDHSPRDVQRRVFAEQIALARDHDLALVIHTREAWAETFDILGAEGVPGRTVFHCFTGGPDEARQGLDLGIHLSFSGIVTFPSAPEVRAAAALCPLDRLLVETDAPYLTPVPHRGRPNRPALVAVVGEAVAEVKGVAVDVLAESSWTAAERLYRLADPSPGDVDPSV